MGWTYCRNWKSAEDVRREVLTGWDDSYKVLAEGWGGGGYDGDRVLYAALEHRTKGRVIAVWLVNGDADGWGYKPMDESMGPYYYQPPRAVFEAAEPGGEYANPAWRAKVRELLGMAPAAQLALI